MSLFNEYVDHNQNSSSNRTEEEGEKGPWFVPKYTL